MNEDAITEENIVALVNRFYEKVRADEELGPVFDAAVGRSDEAWKPHLTRMYDFWSSVMLGTGRYHGNPMRKHLDLPDFDRGLFARWLALFAETVRELHTDSVAELYLNKSSRIALSLMARLYNRDRALIM